MKTLLLALATSTAVLAADVTNAVPGQAEVHRANGTGAGNSLHRNGADGTGMGNSRSQPSSEHHDPNAMPARKEKSRKARNPRARYNVRDSKSKASRNTNHPNVQPSSTPKATPTPPHTPAPAPTPVPDPGAKP